VGGGVGGDGVVGSVEEKRECSYKTMYIRL